VLFYQIHPLFLRAGPKKNFIDMAIEPAQTSEKETTVPASVTIAQAILESGWGKHHIGDANNYFGIKATERDGAVDIGNIAIGYVEANTREVIAGKSVVVHAKFRKYASMTDSFRDHGYFLQSQPRYMEAFKHTEDPDEFARQIHTAGYATDPNYAALVTRIMVSNSLYQFNVVSRNTLPVASPPWVQHEEISGRVFHEEYPLLKEGTDDVLVFTLRYLLMEAGYELTQDRNFTPEVTTAVKAFQAAQRLTVDGIVGKATWQALTPTRKLGDQGNAVAAIQDRLWFYDVGATFPELGNFDETTTVQVKHYQEVNKLSVDGIVGPETWKSLLKV
jgi:murein L,D-transpeptidase YcbB/YkuD